MTVIFVTGGVGFITYIALTVYVCARKASV